jgi:hypothetical protein
MKTNLIIFSNFLPSAGSGFDNSFGWNIEGSGSASPQSVAASFIPTQSYNLTSFELAGYHDSGTNAYSFSLVQDSGGEPTGTTVFSSSGALTGTALTPAIDSFAASGTLTSGTTYWLVMDAGAADTVGSWQNNATGQTGSVSTNDNSGGGWSGFPGGDTPAFRISGSLMPEPSSLAFLTLGATLVIVKRRRKQQVGS